MPYVVTAAISPRGMVAVIAVTVVFAFLTQALADRVVRSEQERRAPADPRRDPAPPILVDAGNRVIA